MNSKLIQFTSISILSAIVIAILIIGKVVFVPLVFALLFAIAITPLCNRFERMGFHRVLAILSSLIFITLLFGLIVIIFSIMFANIYEELPEIQSKIDAGVMKVESNLGILSSYAEEKIEEEIFASRSKLLAPIWSFIQNSIGSSLTAIGNMFLVLLYTFLLLYYRKGIVSVLLKHQKSGNKKKTNYLLHQIQEVVSGYFNGMLFVMFILGTINSLALWLIGIDYPVFWGFLAGTLVIIPYVGTAFGGLFPFLYALATTDTMWQPIAVVSVYAVVQILEGNFITPNVVGSKIKVNALTLIIGMIIGGLIWGLVGIILALPIIAVFKTILVNNSASRMFGEMMSDDLADQ